MTVNARFCFRNFHDEAVLTATEAATNFPVTETQNRSRDSAWRSTTTGTVVLSGAFTRARVINFFAMFRHRNHGSNIRFQGYTDAAWTTPATGGDTTAVAVNKIIGSGSDSAFAFGDDPYGIGQYDPLFVESPYWFWFPSLVTIQSYKITLSSHSTTFWNDAYWHSGRFWLGKYFEPRINPAYDGSGFGWKDNTTGTRTHGGSNRTTLGARWRLAKMKLDSIDEVEAPTWLDGQAMCQTGKEIVASLFPEDGTRKERDNTVCCTLSSLDLLGRSVGRLTTTLQLEET